MATTSVLRTRTRYHVDAAEFVFDALRYAQELLDRMADLSSQPEEFGDFDEEQIHITGQELLEGIRDLALNRFGLMARYVFASWGVTCTEDFGRIVFDLVEQGKMRKTNRDQLSDFCEIYDFAQALDQNYRCSTDLPVETVQPSVI